MNMRASAIILVTLLIAACERPRSAEPWTIDLGEGGEIEIAINDSEIDRFSIQGWVDNESRTVHPTNPVGLYVRLPVHEGTEVCSLQNGSPAARLGILGRSDTQNIGEFRTFADRLGAENLSGYLVLRIDALRSNPRINRQYRDYMPNHFYAGDIIFTNASDFILICDDAYEHCYFQFVVADGTTVFDRIVPVARLSVHNINQCIDELLAYSRNSLRALYRERA